MHYKDLFRIRGFRDLWLGQAISQIGDAFYYVVFMFMVKKATGSNAMVGYVGALETLPYLLLSPYAGVLADRLDRKRIMLSSDLVSAAVLALFAAYLCFVPNPATWTLLLVPALLSTVRVFFMPAKSAAIPGLVPKEGLQVANAVSMTTQSMVPMLGLALSASVLGLLYSTAPFWAFIGVVAVNGLSFLVSAMFIARLPSLQPERDDAHESHAWQDFKDGLAYVKSRREVSVLIALLVPFRLAVAPFFVTYVAANELWFGNRPSTLSWFEFAFFAGMVLFSPLVGRMRITRPTVAFMVGLAGVGLLVAGMAVARTIWGFMLLNGLCGLFVPLADIPVNTYLQASIPDAYRGRVNSVVSMIATGVMPIGAALGGILIDQLGLVGTFLLMGGGMMLAVLIGAFDRTFRSVVFDPRSTGVVAEPQMLGANPVPEAS